MKSFLWAILLLASLSASSASVLFRCDAGDPEFPFPRGKTERGEFGNRAGVRCTADILKTSLATDALRDAFTIVADLYVVPKSDGYQAAVARDCWGGAKGDVFSLLLVNGKWACRVKNATGSLKTLEGPRATAGWHLAIFSYDGENMTLNLDGKLKKKLPQKGLLSREPETPLVIGSYSNSPNGRWLGAIHEIRLFDSALSSGEQDEIAALWRKEIRATWEKDGFYFAEAADVHITDTKSVEILNRGVDSINADSRIAFSLWLGDLTATSEPDQMILARLGLARLTQPSHVIRGNHDLRGAVYKDQFGELRKRFDYRGWVFLLVDSNPGDKTPISKEDREWVKRELAGIAPEVPIVLATHHPLMPHSKAYRLAGSKEFIALFAKHNLKAALSGHYHGNQEEIVDGVLFTTTACLSSTRGNFDKTTAKGYRLFHCKDGTISTEFVPVEH